MTDADLLSFVEWARLNPWCTDPETLRRVFTAYDHDEGPVPPDVPPPWRYEAELDR